MLNTMWRLSCPFRATVMRCHSLKRLVKPSCPSIRNIRPSHAYTTSPTSSPSPVSSASMVTTPIPPSPTPSIGIWKFYLAPTVFALMTVSGTFLMAASQYERHETLSWRQKQFVRDQLRKKLHNIDEDTLVAAQWRSEHDKHHQYLDASADRPSTSHHPADEPPPSSATPSTLHARWHDWTHQARRWWQEQTQSPAHRTVVCLIGVNAVVFVGWRVLPASFMLRWFTYQPMLSVGPRTINLITSTFSHRSFLHLSVNTVALWTLGASLHEFLGRHQFLAFYVSSGITSTLVSHLVWLSLLRRFCSIAGPRMGANAALYACLAALITLHPSAPFPFFPQLQNDQALSAFLATDVAGILLNWPMLDHCGNIAGAGFGLTYMMYGQEKMWIPLVRKIRDIRERNQRNGRGPTGPPTTVIDLPAPQFPWMRRIAKDS
ncbi:hypothetical protein DM01DRAFT_1382072 [Hesseltinella vesiculosa]|uniref:Peptidase S54 rhomboid domain-containing protein n=1 Tax=Hesseltinella vesiculosa TaxID=101127 RepID=A0A1X2GN45_9FUNG|nr:hypothetical protein DM01DRAFT_1382072 [Hesseltinella vesiculosa]